MLYIVGATIWARLNLTGLGLIFVSFIIFFKQITMVSCDWFKLMLSIPLQEPMTRAALFVQWSSMLAYNILGLTILVAPQMWKGSLQLEFSGRTEGYFRLQAVAQLELGFLYIIFARSKFNVPGNGAVLKCQP